VEGLSWKPIERAIAAAIFLVVHTFLAALLITCMYALERWIKYLWAVDNPLLFNLLPITYIFDAIDLGFIVIFGYRGLLAANNAFKHED